METETIDLQNVTCPFCGLACDDLQLRASARGLSVAKNGCAISSGAFATLGDDAQKLPAARVAGKPASIEQAVNAAAKLLARAQAPLIAGLGTDVSGARAALQLADRIGAVVDHMNMPAKLRNLATVQNAGWITTTLAEVKNRADFVLLVGSGTLTRFPRFLQRIVAQDDAMFIANAAARTVYVLGEIESQIADLPNNVTRLHCSHSALPRLLPALRALVNKQPLQEHLFAASDLKILREIVSAMQRANYGVIVWAAPDFNFPHGELSVQTLAEMIKDLNKSKRFAGLPLGGSDGDFSGNGVQTWQTGFPLRTRYAKLGLDYDPHRYGADELITAGEVDALLWISSFSATRMPLAGHMPRIVLAPPSSELPYEPDVFIAVGTPGIHHAGHFIRADKVVVMHLAKLLGSKLPSVAEAVEQIRHRLDASV